MTKDCFLHTLPNGLRMIHLPVSSPVAYCGLAVNAGARDEGSDEFGLAHFVEHMLFKGTQKRKAWHILNRMEYVGGELNACTSKEETFVYSIFMAENYGRAVELIADLAIHSRFPAHEIEKEREVILDEIQSCEDNPSELIFDEFENILFEGHPLGHHILGNRHSLCSFGSESAHAFVRHHYTAGNMVFFSMGNVDPKRIVRLAEKYLSDIPAHAPALHREKPCPAPLQPLPCRKKKKTHQSHVLIGGRAFDMYDAKRVPLFLLNNILGGPGMNSRLNVSLREKSGLVYNAESNVTAYTDTGLCSVYFGTDPKNRDRVTRLTENELRRLRENRLSDFQLSAAKKQAIGQLGISSDHKENLFLGLGKAFLHRDRYERLPELFAKVNAVTASQLQDIANELFAPERLFTLIYE
ncbi:MAG: insulinase family protein [Tannerella sp.]|jgi:predicted Zn-dependent peptidase|nr:insulinase family protein [Tannerella sp.]